MVTILHRFSANFVKYRVEKLLKQAFWSTSKISWNTIIHPHYYMSVTTFLLAKFRIDTRSHFRKKPLRSLTADKALSNFYLFLLQILDPHLLFMSGWSRPGTMLTQGWCCVIYHTKSSQIKYWRAMRRDMGFFTVTLIFRNTSPGKPRKYLTPSENKP